MPTKEEEKELEEFQAQIVKAEQLALDRDISRELAEGDKAEDVETFKKQFDKSMSDENIKAQILKKRRKEKEDKIAQKRIDEEFYLGEKGAKTLRKFGTVKKGRVDPLAGLVKKSSKTKGKRGRPRKYKPIPQTGRPRGRPVDKSMRIGKLDFYEDEGVPEIQREPYIPPTPQQQRLLQLFGNKQQFWGFGGNPVKINRKLSSGNGIIKSGDGGATGRMFGVRR